MAASIKQFGLGMMSGQDKSWPASAARAATRMIEPIYSSAMSVRNLCYDRGIFPALDLGRPTLSVGNITTGGTGKTPVVRWLCEQLQQRGRHPAVLLRGYGQGTFSDEAELLKQVLKDVPVQPNPSRVAGAGQVLKDHPEIDLFVLDDAFQHRKAKRDFNLVLISATQGFGFGHVLPRGLLRETLAGLKRADAFLITRSSLGNSSEIDRYLMDHHPSTPVFHCDHELAIHSIAGKKVFLTAGIGDPISFEKQIADLGFHVVGTRWVDDHHLFTAADLIAIDQSAKKANADIVLTTEKDWVKMKSQLPATNEILIGVVNLKLSFQGTDEEGLLELVLKKV